MTIGKMKIEALKLMFLNLRDIHEDQLDELGADINYSDYLSGMPGAINRALRQIVARQILPVKSRVINLKEGEKTNEVYRFDLSSIISDYYNVSGVIRSREVIGEERIDYGIEGDALLLYRPDEKSTYRVVYHPNIPVVTSGTLDTMDVAMPEELASLVPYFIKADLYAKDNEDAASQALARFEAGVAEYAARPRAGERKRVVTKFGLGW